MRNILSFCLFTVLTIQGFCKETKSIELKGLVIFQQHPIENFRIEFAGYGSVITKTDGSFTYSLPANYEFSTITIQIPDSLKLLEPNNGILILPKSSAQQVTIRVGTSDEKEVFDLVQQEIQRVLDTTEKNSDLQTEIILNKVEVLLNESKVDYDSIREIMLSEQEYKLLIEREKNKYRASLVVPVMDSVYDFYISRAKDLRDAFERYGDNVFYNEEYSHRISSRIDLYSEAYELLNAKKSFITKNAEIYYDPTLAMEIRFFIYEQTLQYFHKDKILTANILMSDITNYNHRAKGRRKRSELRNDINKYTVDLSTSISNISENKERLAQKLSY